MKNVFLDCGTHLCEGLKTFWNKKIIDKNFEIHTFEPNPECKVLNRIKNLPFELEFHDCAVWVHNEGVWFRQENHRISKSGSPSDNHSDLDGWASSVAGTGFEFPGYNSPLIFVNSIDFSEFVLSFPSQSKIIIKMDIEGCEFAVLRKMIKDDSIKKIDSIYVEFHEKHMSTETAESKNELVQEITKLGVKVHNWF